MPVETRSRTPARTKQTSRRFVSPPHLVTKKTLKQKQEEQKRLPCQVLNESAEESDSEQQDSEDEQNNETSQEIDVKRKPWSLGQKSYQEQQNDSEDYEMASETDVKDKHDLSLSDDDEQQEHQHEQNILSFSDDEKIDDLYVDCNDDENDYTWHFVPSLFGFDTSAPSFTEKKTQSHKRKPSTTVEKVLKNSDLHHSSNKKRKLDPEHQTAGKKWFNLPATSVTPEIKQHLTILANRSHIDPKRHYKKEKNPIPKFFEIGTVLPGASEYYTAATKKQRKQTLTQQLLEDPEARRYIKKKAREIETRKRSGKKVWKKKQSKRAVKWTHQ